jgi:hypothetical protein
MDSQVSGYANEYGIKPHLLETQRTQTRDIFAAAGRI